MGAAVDGTSDVRICPHCGVHYPAIKHPEHSRLRHAVWWCVRCRNKERKREQRESDRIAGRLRHKPNTPGACVGHGPKRTTPETAAKLKALFDRDPDKVIHQLCKLLEGMPCTREALCQAVNQREGLFGHPY